MLETLVDRRGHVVINDHALNSKDVLVYTGGRSVVVVL
jgi:hypothetical protein